MLKRDANQLQMLLEMEFVWSVALRLSRKNAQNVTILKNNSYVCLNTEKSDFNSLASKYFIL